MKTLPEEIMGAKFGTKNRAELILRTDAIKNAVKDIIWMARRYANERLTGAPDTFNDAYDILRSQLGDEIDAQQFSDMWKDPKYYDITIEHTKDHPYAVYGTDDHPSQTNDQIKQRKFYKK